jgi:hypothetical protein
VHWYCQARLHDRSSRSVLGLPSSGSGGLASRHHAFGVGPMVSIRRTRNFSRRCADHLDADAGPAPKALILAKSLGSYAAAWASSRRYSAIWLTSVLTDDVVAEALARYSAEAIAGRRDRDSLWDSQRPAATNLQHVEISNADHALHMARNGRGSIGALEQPPAAVERFAIAARQTSREP